MNSFRPEALVLIVGAIHLNRITCTSNNENLERVQLVLAFRVLFVVVDNVVVVVVVDDVVVVDNAVCFIVF